MVGNPLRRARCLGFSATVSPLRTCHMETEAGGLPPEGVRARRMLHALAPGVTSDWFLIGASPEEEIFTAADGSRFPGASALIYTKDLSLDAFNAVTLSAAEEVVEKAEDNAIVVKLVCDGQLCVLCVYLLYGLRTHPAVTQRLRDDVLNAALVLYFRERGVDPHTLVTSLCLSERTLTLDGRTTRALGGFVEAHVQQLNKTCQVCALYTRRKCSGCQVVPYCGVTCHRVAWPKHKEACRREQARRAEAERMGA